MTGDASARSEVTQFIQASETVGFMESDRKTVGGLIQSYLNYTPNELNLKEHARKAVDEAIIKGMGVLWTELIELEKDQQGGTFGIVGSFYDSADNLLLDPDADEQEDCLWSARRCVHPLKDVAEQYGLEPDELKGHIESNASIADDNNKTKRKNGKTNDLIVYWKIYSKTGFGHTLKASLSNSKTYSRLGKNCYIVVAEGVDYP